MSSSPVLSTSDAEPDTDLERLVRALDEAGTAIALVDAVRDLAAAKLPEAIPHLMNALKFNNPGAAVAAVEGLVALGTVAVEPIMAQIDGYNYGARAWATRALSEIGDPRALDLMLAVADGDFAPSVRRSAVKGLGCLHWEELEPELCQQQQQQVAPVMIKACTDVEWVVRYGAIAGIQALLSNPTATAPELRDPLINILKQVCEEDSDLGIRLRSRYALQSLAIA
ncbi:MAG: HEAT repeat domain-containing protein [Cyanobacteria bacterium P01_D01_bin.73]